MGGCFGPPTKEAVSFAEFVHRAQTGDVILFSGSGAISMVIEIGSFSRYSHAATVIKNKDNPSEIYLLESSVIDATKDINGRKKSGVRLIGAYEKFRDYVKYYGREFYWIRLLVPHKDFNPLNYDFKRNMEWVRSIYPKGYEDHPDEFLNVIVPFIPQGTFSFLDGPDATPEDAYFCSELSVKHLAFLGAANPDISPDTVGPKVFDAIYPIVRGVPLLKPGYRFAPLVAIDFSHCK